MSRKIMQQAHDALLALISEIADTHPMAGFDEYDSDAFKHACAVERALRAALAEPAAPQGEAVAWRYGASYWGSRDGVPFALRHFVVPLYAAPPAAPSGEEA